MTDGRMDTAVRTLGGNDLKRMIFGAADHLEALKAKVDALNVFPVPDGDTGTNMSLTMKSACREIAKISSDSASDVAQALSLGSLMGARGNSGVILSQLFRGMAKSLEGKRRVSAQDLAWSFQEAVTSAYNAVMKPVEGTILTVAREHSRAANQMARQGASVEDTLEFAQRQAEAALARTPDLLPVLKQAGVVDAGGKGLVVIWEGALRALQGAAEVEVATTGEAQKKADFRITEEISEIANAYDVQFLLKGPSLPVAEIRGELSNHGDSLLVVGTEKLVKVHVHANRPGAVLDYCLSFGDLLDVVVENMRLQHETLKGRAALGDGTGAGAGDGAPGGADEDGAIGEGTKYASFGSGRSNALDVFAEAADVSLSAGEAGTVDSQAYLAGPAPQREIAVVTVAVGQGLIELFRMQGADEIIEGGQTMNPSTEEIQAAIERAPAKKVIFIPNNGNIIMAAKQAAEICSKEVRIIPSKSIPDGFAALVKLNSEAGLEENAQAMTEAIGRARSGEVTYSVRSANYNGLSIAAGDTIGLGGGEIMCVGRNPEQVLADLVGRLIQPGDAVATVFYGSDISDDQAEAARQAIQDKFPDLEVEFLRGGQPLYYYLVSIE